MTNQTIAERIATAEYRMTRAWRQVLQRTGWWHRLLPWRRHNAACRDLKRLHKLQDRAAKRLHKLQDRILARMTPAERDGRELVNRMHQL